jgi:hypothetical protein
VLAKHILLTIHPTALPYCGGFLATGTVCSILRINSLKDQGFPQLPDGSISSLTPHLCISVPITIARLIPVDFATIRPHLRNDRSAGDLADSRSSKKRQAFASTPPRPRHRSAIQNKRDSKPHSHPVAGITVSRTCNSNSHARCVSYAFVIQFLPLLDKVDCQY